MQITTANLEGRPHLIVPTVLGVVGVWNGSNGPLPPVVPSRAHRKRIKPFFPTMAPAEAR
jgi:hypothetical protein